MGCITNYLVIQPIRKVGSNMENKMKMIIVIAVIIGVCVFAWFISEYFMDKAIASVLQPVIIIILVLCAIISIKKDKEQLDDK